MHGQPVAAGVPGAWWTGLSGPARDAVDGVGDPVPVQRVRNSRVFGTEKPAPADATDSEAFLA